MVTLDSQAVRNVLNNLDGWIIVDPEEMISQGIPAEVVLPLIEIYESNPSDHKQSIYDGDGNLLNQLRGVYGLKLLYAIADNVGADTLEANSKIGRGSRAEALKKAIVAALNT